MGSTLGLSGALIEHLQDGTTVKYTEDPERWDFLNSQATYMAECGYPFVEVRGIAHGRYWMRTYKKPDLVSFSPQLLIEAKESLIRLWDTDNPRFIDRSNWKTAHRNRLRELFDINEIEDSMRRNIQTRFEEIADTSHRLTVCTATHGDATLDNVLIDPICGDIRWIDPIPPSLWLPAFKALDLGKMLQSARGWEYFLNHQRELVSPSIPDAIVLHGESIEDKKAAQYFLGLCYLRILRYARDKSQPVWDYAMKGLESEFL